jgi:SAM-dependent methyltransferase
VERKAVSGMQDFYREVVGQLLRARVVDTSTEMLVLCGGRKDAAVLRECGFERVVISNITPPRAQDVAPFGWSRQDAEHLSYADESFDFCIVHNGLHHCQSPHRALTEMYRVARKGLLLFEPYDNLLTRLGVRLKIGQEYEHAALYFNNNHHGGATNSDIPNYIYRWTEREILKTVNSYAPYGRHDVRFMHAMRIPWGQLRGRRSKVMLNVVRLAQPALWLLDTCLPKQSNNFAAVVLKPDLPLALHPWLREDGGDIRLNPQWVATQYGR